MKIRTRFFPMMSALALLATLSVPSYADDKSASAGKPDPELRKKMAEMHQKMADCLKSDKPLSECRDEARKDCPMKDAKGGCPMMHEMDSMMGMHGHMHGHGHGHGMGPGKGAASPSKDESKKE